MRIGIVGAGLAGSVLAYQFFQRGIKDIVLFDPMPKSSSSKVAAGLYNPITGKQRKFTWKVEEIFSMIEPFYQEIEIKCKTRFLFPLPILMPFVSEAEKQFWEKADLSHSVIKVSIAEQTAQNINAPYGAMLVSPSGYLNTSKFLDSIHDFFLANNISINKEAFEYNLLFENGNGWQYRNNKFDKVIFCEGHQVANNPYFNYLGLAPVKGEILDLMIEELGDEQIINKAMFLLPNEAEGSFRCGSTYRHAWEKENEPEVSGMHDIQRRLEKIYEGKYEILGAKAGVRPATKDRKPILGAHHSHQNLYVFNGLGTKGVSLAPYFGKMMLDLVLNNIQPTIDVNSERFLTT